MGHAITESVHVYLSYRGSGILSFLKMYAFTDIVDIAFVDTESRAVE